MPLSCLKQSLRQRPESPSNPFPFVNSKSLLLDPLRSPHVHLPPSPSLTSVQLTHSPNSYDRRAIDVDTINACALALPERFDRYYDPSIPPELECGNGLGLEPGYFDMDGSSSLQPPPLIPDLTSSESDESLPSSPPDIYTPHVYSRSPSSSSTMAIRNKHVAYQSYPNHPPIPRRDTAEDLGNALAFLPYPPTVSIKEPSPPPKRRTTRMKRVSTANSFDEGELDGCLGGF